MIRAANHSSYPRIGDNPLDQQMRTASRRLDRGTIDRAAWEAIADEVTSIAIAEQARAFIDVLTDGMVRWSGPVSHVARNLDGFELREPFRWLDTDFYDRRPELVGSVRHREPFLVRAFEVSQDVAASRPVKTTLPGPVTFARIARRGVASSVPDLARALTEALAHEVRALAAAGAKWLQIDEPLLASHPEDVELVAETSAALFEALGAGSSTLLAVYGGDMASLAEDLGRLPGTHLAIDVVSARGNRDLIARLPERRGLYLGVFDARSTWVEDAADVFATIEPYREALTSRDVLVGPNAGLETLPRDHAFEKLLQARYLVERLRKEWTWDS